MFGLAWCVDGGPGFVNASVRGVTNARKVGMRMRRKCAGSYRHARVDASSTSRETEQTGAWVRRVAQVMKGQLKGDERKWKTQEQKKKAKDAKSIRGIVHENDRNKGASRANEGMGHLMRHDEQELLSL